MRFRFFPDRGVVREGIDVLFTMRMEQRYRDVRSVQGGSGYVYRDAPGFFPAELDKLAKEYYYMNAQNV